MLGFVPQPNLQDRAIALVEKHPDKTFIGRISRGFDFLGYWFSPSGLGVALKTVERCLEKVSRLYEQGASVERIGKCVGRWWQWVMSVVTRVREMGEHRSFSIVLSLFSFCPQFIIL